MQNLGTLTTQELRKCKGLNKYQYYCGVPNNNLSILDLYGPHVILRITLGRVCTNRPIF